MLILNLYNKTYIAIQKFEVVKILYVFEEKKFLMLIKLASYFCGNHYTVFFWIQNRQFKRTAFILNRNPKDYACLYCWFW